MADALNRELDPRALKRGRAIIDARKRQELSQEDLAQALGVSRVAVSHWERGTIGEIERTTRLGLCKLLGFEERELLLDPEGAEQEFEMPLSRDAKSIAYRYDDLPDTIKAEIKAKIAEFERMQRTNPEYVKHLFPEFDTKPPRKTG